MVHRFIDISNQTFGKLRAIEPTECDSSRRMKWRCECACGKICFVASSHLKRGQSKSCGCDRDANFHARTHQLSGSSEYRIWYQMHSRCKRTNDVGYENYGGRGIAVCERWSSFINFYEDMGPRPSRQHSIDRIDNNAGYSPSNCRWAEREVQHRNKRNNRFLSLDGETYCVADWAKKKGLRFNTITRRLSRGWPTRAVIEAPKSMSKKQAMKRWPQEIFK